MNMIIYRISIHLEDIKQAMFRHFMERPGIVGAKGLGFSSLGGGRRNWRPLQFLGEVRSQLSRTSRNINNACVMIHPHTDIILYYYTIIYIYIIKLYIYIYIYIIYIYCVYIYIYVNSSFIVAHGCWLYSDLCFVYPLARSP